jgi:glycosyltransferase involved in cell wall biosynthesis
VVPTLEMIALAHPGLPQKSPMRMSISQSDEFTAGSGSVIGHVAQGNATVTTPAKAAQPLNILHVCQYSDRRGAETVMARYVSALADRGHVVAAAFPGNGPLPSELIRRGIPVHYFGRMSCGRIPQLAGTLCRIVRSTGAQIMHTHDGRAGLLGRVCRRLMPSLILVSSVHGLRARYAGPQFLSDGWSRRVKRYVRATLYRYVDRCSRSCSDVVLAHSDAIAADLTTEGVYCNKLVVLRHGLPEDWATQATSGARGLRELLPQGMRSLFLVGLVGSVEPTKGHHVLMEAIPGILRRCGDVGFVFVGVARDGLYKARLQARAAELGINGRVWFTGELSPMQAMYRDLDVVVQASYTEGLPLAIMEAMAIGKPVVATAVGGTRELIADGVTGVLVGAGDPQALARAISELLDSPDDRLRLSDAAHHHARSEFALAPVVDRLEAIYEELARARSAVLARA